MELNMKTMGVLMLLALATFDAPAADSLPQPAASKESDSPAFADGWRLSGILKQGGKLQAGMEHPSHARQFVVEGGELIPGVRIEKIDATARNVIVRKGNLIAIIRSGSAPVVVKSSPLVAQTSSQPSAPQPPQPQQPEQPPRPTATAGQDASGRWGIQLSSGQFFSAQDYAARYGGAEQAIARLNSRLASDLPPDRKAFAQQMLTALQNTQTSQSQMPAGGGTTLSSDNATVSPGTVSVSPALPGAAMSPAMEQRGTASMSAEPAGFQDPIRVYRRGPQLSR